jgi:hypothetical protein
MRRIALTPCLPFGGVLAVIQPLEKEQIRKLLDGVERIGKSPVQNLSQRAST